MINQVSLSQELNSNFRANIFFRWQFRLQPITLRKGAIKDIYSLSKTSLSVRHTLRWQAYEGNMISGATMLKQNSVTFYCRRNDLSLSDDDKPTQMFLTQYIEFNSLVHAAQESLLQVRTERFLKCSCEVSLHVTGRPDLMGRAPHS
jgi:hypothetical protein